MEVVEVAEGRIYEASKFRETCIIQMLEGKILPVQSKGFFFFNFIRYVDW
jgi:hypothetical protein